MCSVLTHPVIPIAVAVSLPDGAISSKLLFAGAVCSVVPDLDVIGFRFGITYEEMLGHRGITHSLVFAAALGALLALTLFRDEPQPWLVFTFLFLSALSHPLLDMLTNGGLGVALFAPFSNERYFWPWRPVEVSPIGLAAFFSRWGLRVLSSELRWVWLPSAALVVTATNFRRTLGW
jgi:inner membrane protein